MTPELWERVKTVFDAARERPPGERASFLDAACGGDAALRVEVESLLAADTETLLDPQQARVVELRYFTGLGIEETARVLGISPATVKREWAMARAWLRRELASIT